MMRDKMLVCRAGVCLLLGALGAGAQVELAGVTVTPHVLAPSMRYAKVPDPSLGARVQLFVRNAGGETLRLDASSEILLRGQRPGALVAAEEWAWHDFPDAWPDAPLELPPESLTVWSFNGSREAWGAGTRAALRAPGAADLDVEIGAPDAWISAITFLNDAGGIYPDRMVAHVANASGAPLRVVSCRLWLPLNNETWRVFHPRPKPEPIETLPPDRTIPPGEKGIVLAATGALPLTYAVVELRVDAGTAERALWAHVRVKREAFDISGGWVNSHKDGRAALTFEPFLKLLARLHVNTAHIQDGIPGYTDDIGPEGLYTRYPLKYFNALQPFEHYDTDAMLARIHAAEFIGEPQYGGGRPVPPMEVWTAFAPYQRTRIPTSVTHSEERVWRFYAGLSDYPHYDAYRVTAPSPDVWRKYDRWSGQRIGWGAPLETIGAMCRSLRELNRPAPTAYWSQGPHEGWGIYGGRKRTSPTPDEIRLQAYYALASRITSLYWFNLSLKSVVKFRDTLEELNLIGREMRMLEAFYLEGDAYHHEETRRDNKPDWDLAAIAAPHGALLFALDLDYTPHPEERVFTFGPPRPSVFAFPLPAWMRAPAEVFRVDAAGVHDVRHETTAQGVQIFDDAHKVAIYVAAARPGLREALESRRQSLIAWETALSFDPAKNDADFSALESFLK